MCASAVSYRGAMQNHLMFTHMLTLMFTHVYKCIGTHIYTCLHTTDTHHINYTNINMCPPNNIRPSVLNFYSLFCPLLTISDHVSQCSAPFSPPKHIRQSVAKFCSLFFFSSYNMRLRLAMFCSLFLPLPTISDQVWQNSASCFSPPNDIIPTP